MYNPVNSISFLNSSVSNLHLCCLKSNNNSKVTNEFLTIHSTNYTIHRDKWFISSNRIGKECMKLKFFLNSQIQCKSANRMDMSFEAADHDATHPHSSSETKIKNQESNTIKENSIEMNGGFSKTSFNVIDFLIRSNQIILGLIFSGIFALVFSIYRNKTPTISCKGIASSLITSNATIPKREQLFGHYPYDEADVADLQRVLEDNSVKLKKSAAESFLKMQGDAKLDNVYLIPLSGFRSLETQKLLFFQIKSERNEGLRKRAKVSAPPGYSEHHSGYAVDIGDYYRPQTHLECEFEETPAFKWLQENANRYHFEMSFLKNNEQGVMHEPWHWRFVGDIESIKTFYKQ